MTPQLCQPHRGPTAWPIQAATSVTPGGLLGRCTTKSELLGQQSDSPHRLATATGEASKCRIRMTSVR